MPPWSRLRRWGSVLAILLVTAAILAAVATQFVPLMNKTEEQPAVSRQRPEVLVSAAQVKAMNLQETVVGVGTLEASAEVEISPEISGRIKAIRFEEGAAVEEGTVLFELDEDRLQHQRTARQAAVRAAEVAVDNARSIFERRLQLQAREVLTEEAVEEAEANLNGALAEKDRLEAELSLIERELQDTKILAPMTGVISHHEVDRGAHVGVGQALASFYQIDPLEMNFWLPERHLGRVRQGQPVAVTVAAYPDREFEGLAEFISPAVDPSTRQFLVKAVIPNGERDLTPGMFAVATVTVGERLNRPVLPEESLVATRRGYMVFVIEDGVAVSREVVTGLRQEGWVEIVEGLAVGELVVREGHLRLSGGETVRIESDL
jgi:membrane fusion protein (multidrug efflux system)